MRTKRSAPPAQAAPISAAVVGRARRGSTDDDTDGDARAQLLRVVALLGIGLVAAAILLPSGDPPVVVPGDALQPATASAAAATSPGDIDEDATEEPAPRPASSAFSTRSSAASVVGDDLAAVASTPPSTSIPARKSRGPAAKVRRKTKPSKRSTRTRTRSTPRIAAAPATPTPPPTVATPAAPSPAPAQSPAPQRSRGGPKAEFGGL